MQRREFIRLLGGAAVAVPFVARGQDGRRIRKIGVLMNLPSDDQETQARTQALSQALRRHGWLEGENYVQRLAGRATTPSTTIGTQRNWLGLPRT